MTNLIPINNGPIIRNKISRSFGKGMTPLITYDSVIYPSAMLRRTMGDMDNIAHYNELNDVDYLPPLIPDEREDFYELPSIKDEDIEEYNSGADSIQQYEEGGNSILSVMENWAKAIASIPTSFKKTTLANARYDVTDSSGNLVKSYKLTGLKPVGIGESCNDDENYELPSLVVDDIY